MNSLTFCKFSKSTFTIQTLLLRSLTTGTDENLYSLANDKQFLCTLHICGTYTFRISMSFWITKKVINTNVTNVLIELFNIKVLKKKHVVFLWVS